MSPDVPLSPLPSVIFNPRRLVFSCHSSSDSPRSIVAVRRRNNFLQFIHYRTSAPWRRARSKDKSPNSGYIRFKGIVLKTVIRQSSPEVAEFGQSQVCTVQLLLYGCRREPKCVRMLWDTICRNSRRMNTDGATISASASSIPLQPFSKGCPSGGQRTQISTVQHYLDSEKMSKNRVHHLTMQISHMKKEEASLLEMKRYLESMKRNEMFKLEAARIEFGIDGDTVEEMTDVIPEYERVQMEHDKNAVAVLRSEHEIVDMTKM